MSVGKLSQSRGDLSVAVEHIVKSQASCYAKIVKNQGANSARLIAMTESDRKQGLIEQHVKSILDDFSSGNLVLALNKAKELSQRHPQVSLLHNLMGVILVNSGRRKDAIKSYNRALKINPDSYEAHNNLGNVYKGLGMLEKAAEHFERGVQINPGLAHAHNTLGLTLKALNQADRAVNCYEKAIELDPDYSEAYNNLGIVYTESGEIEKASRCYERALQLVPGFAIAHKNYSVIKKVREGR